MFAYLFPRARAEWLVCLLLVVATGVAYSPLVENQFLTFDDGVYISWNPHVQAGLSAESMRWALTSTSAHNWHPLTWIAHIVDWQIFGNRPAGHHLVNLSIHVLSAIVLFLVLERLTTFAPNVPGKTARRRRDARRPAPATIWPSALVAMLFAVHPLHVESVAWAAERKDTLCALCYWLALGAYGYYATAPNLRRYLLVTLFFALGLMAKPMIVSLPVVLWFLDYWPLGRWDTRNQHTSAIAQQRRRLISEKIPWLLLVIASSAVTYIAQWRGGATAMLDPIPVPLRFVNAAMATTSYLRQAIWPTGLCCFYPYPAWLMEPGGWQRPEAVGAMIFIGVATFAAIVATRARRYVLVGWLWYLATLLPALGLIQVGRQSRADRYTYIPLEGIFIIVAWGFWEFAGRLPAAGRRWSVVPVALALLALGVTTWRQVEYWRDDISVFGHAVAVTENNKLAHFNLGSALTTVGRVDEGVEHLRAAVAIDPNYANAWSNLAVALEQAGQGDEAVKCFHRALELQPYWPSVMGNLAWHYSTQPDALSNNGAEAVRLAERLVSLDPYADARHVNILAAAYAAAGRFDEAIVTANRSFELAKIQRQADLMAKIPAQLAAFRGHRTWCETPITPTRSTATRPGQRQ